VIDAVTVADEPASAAIRGLPTEGATGRVIGGWFVLEPPPPLDPPPGFDEGPPPGGVWVVPPPPLLVVFGAGAVVNVKS
jgi:hypothetical protein